jgi:hypothetical protein
VTTGPTLTRTQRAVGSAVALGMLVLLVGTAVFLAARDEPAPPPTTTTTTSTTISADDLADAIAASLQTDLTVALTQEEARCVADAVLRLVPAEDLAALVERPQPLTGVAPAERDELVRAVVDCVPEASAAALLGSATTTSEPEGLPGQVEG